MCQQPLEPPAREPEAVSSHWTNVVLEPGDAEVACVDRMVQRIGPIPPAARVIRNLITRLEICHFKIERHFDQIIESIGRMDAKLDPETIGRNHPKAGETAWRRDSTGRSRPAQEYMWVLEMWLDAAPYRAGDPRGVPRRLFEEVHRALGERDATKARLVTALLDRLRLKPDRKPVYEEFGGLGLQIEMTDICHYTFPENMKKVIRAIGRLEPAQGFEGCGSYDDARILLAQSWFRDLCAWLRGEEGPMDHRLRDRTCVKVWLTASIAKTLKQHVGLQEAMDAFQPPAKP